MLSHLWFKNRSIVRRWKIDYVKLNKHRSLARVQMHSLRDCAKAAARGRARRGTGHVCCPPWWLCPVSPAWCWWQPRVLPRADSHRCLHNHCTQQQGRAHRALPANPQPSSPPWPVHTIAKRGGSTPRALPNHQPAERHIHGAARLCAALLCTAPCAAATAPGLEMWPYMGPRAKQ